MVSLFYQQCCQGFLTNTWNIIIQKKAAMKWDTLKFESIQIAQVLKPSTRDMYTKASNMETAE